MQPVILFVKQLIAFAIILVMILGPMALAAMSGPGLAALPPVVKSFFGA